LALQNGKRDADYYNRAGPMELCFSAQGSPSPETPFPGLSILIAQGLQLSNLALRL
jgi:hypothetical protein